MKTKKYYYRRAVNTKLASRPRAGNKRKKVLRLGIYFVFLVTIFFLLYAGARKLAEAASSWQEMNVKEIEISGGKNVTKSEIKELLPFNVGDNLLKIDLKVAKDDIKKLKPELKDISMSRRWQKVKIKLHERTPEAFVQKSGKLYGIDFEDKLFPLRGFMDKTLVPVIEYKNELQRQELLKFIKSFKTVGAGFLEETEYLGYNNCDEIFFKTREGALVLWGDERYENTVKKFAKFSKIYADAKSRYGLLERVDMTLYDSGRAVVKPAAQEEVQA